MKLLGSSSEFASLTTKIVMTLLSFCHYLYLTACTPSSFTGVSSVELLLTYNEMHRV